MDGMPEFTSLENVSLTNLLSVLVDLVARIYVKTPPLYNW